MGFERAAARAALRKSNQNVEAALEHLLQAAAAAPAAAVAAPGAAAAAAAAERNPLARMFGAAVQPLAPSAALVRSASVGSGGSSRSSGARGSVKSCGHLCELSVRCPTCCRCGDQRPALTEGTYRRYVDGSGWQNSARRDAGYCPACKR